MARLLGLLLAVTAGVATALLLASWVKVEDDKGRMVPCTTVISAAAVDGSGSSACADALTRRVELSALTGLLCIAGATVVVFTGRPPEPARLVAMH